MGPCICGSARILSVSGKTSDGCCMDYGDVQYDGYIPSGLNLGHGDYLEFDLCLECGHIKGTFPISDATVIGALES